MVTFLTEWTVWVKAGATALEAGVASGEQQTGLGIKIMVLNLIGNRERGRQRERDKWLMMVLSLLLSQLVSVGA